MIMIPKITSIFIVLLFILSCCTFFPDDPYIFRQSTECISQIDILKQINENATWEQRFTVIATLDPSQHATFTNHLVSITGQNFFNPPETSFHLFVVRITYKDGEEEYISSSNNGYRLPDSDIQLDTYWFSDKDGFNSLISQYVGYDISEEVYEWNRHDMFYSDFTESITEQ